MRVDRFKRLVAPVLVGAALLAAVSVLVGAALLQRRASTGTDPASAFTEVPEGAAALAGVVVWERDGSLPERVIEPATRRALEAAWTRAWEARQRAALGDASLLEASFSGAALDQARVMAADASAPVVLRFGRHHLRATFYSDDGAVVGLRAAPVRVEQVIEAGGHDRVLRTDDTYQVVLLLEDGNWRVRQWERTGSTPVQGDLAGS